MLFSLKYFSLSPPFGPNMAQNEATARIPPCAAPAPPPAAQLPLPSNPDDLFFAVAFPLHRPPVMVC